MKTLILLLLAFLIPAGAMAQSSTTVCQVVASHHARADVMHKATNVDATPNAFETPEVVKVPLTVDLAKRVASLTGKDIQLESGMGMVEIHQNGKVFYNGQDWTSSVMSLCGQSHVVTASVEPEVPAAPEPILNRAPILNKSKIINRAPANDRRAVVPIDVEMEPRVEKRSEPVAKTIPDKPEKTEERKMINVRPIEAIPPIDVDSQPKAMSKTASVKMREPEIIQGGDYREIFYNE